MKLSFCRAQVLLALAAGVISACTMRSNELVNQSRFSYPNGDYATLGRVSAEKTYFSTAFSTPQMDRQKFSDLQQQALAQQPDADFIVNYMISSSVTTPGVLPIAWTTFHIEGTAVKVGKLGGQIYSQGNKPDAEQGK